MHPRRIEDALRSDDSDHIRTPLSSIVHTNVSSATLKNRLLDGRPLRKYVLRLCMPALSTTSTLYYECVKHLCRIGLPGTRQGIDPVSVVLIVSLNALLPPAG